MAKGLSLFDRLGHRMHLRRWARASRSAATADLPDLRTMRNAARALRGHIDDVLYKSEERLALPMVGSNAFPRPHDCDWAWRPQLWRGPLSKPGIAAAANRDTIGDEVTLFHDCKVSELTLRQMRNTRAEDLAPYGLRMDVLNFDGSFLSLAINLPADSTKGLGRGHLIRLDCIVELEYPIEIFARLNVKHGPNTEQVVRELPLHEDQVMVEFDLAYTKLNEKRVDDAWVDLIFEGPRMNQIVLRDLTFARRPRAPL